MTVNPIDVEREVVESDVTRSSAAGSSRIADQSGPVDGGLSGLRSRRRASSSEVSFRSLLAGTQRFEARRVRRIIRHVDPWSMFKVAFILLVCAYVVGMIASVIVWSVAVGSGTIAKIESFIGQTTGNDFRIDGHFLFRFTGLLGLVVTVAMSAGALVGSIAFNLVSDLVGGVWVTVIEEETARPVSGSSG